MARCLEATAQRNEALVGGGRSLVLPWGSRQGCVDVSLGGLSQGSSSTVCFWKLQALGCSKNYAQLDVG